MSNIGPTFPLTTDMDVVRKALTGYPIRIDIARPVIDGNENDNYYLYVDVKVLSAD